MYNGLRRTHVEYLFSGTKEELTEDEFGRVRVEMG